LKTPKPQSLKTPLLKVAICLFLLVNYVNGNEWFSPNSWPLIKENERNLTLDDQAEKIIAIISYVTIGIQGLVVLVSMLTRFKNIAYLIP